MRLIGITTASEGPTNRALSAACEALGVEWVVVSSVATMVTPEPGDALYRVTDRADAVVAEQVLVSAGVASVYTWTDRDLVQWTNPLAKLVRVGLPIVAPVALPADEPDALRAQVEALGGYPLLVVVPGEPWSSGVMQVDSFAALYSLTDFLRARRKPHALYRVDDGVRHVRVYVVGDEAVEAIEDLPGEGDVRPRGPGSTSRPFDAGPVASAIAVAATQALGLGFAGVDLVLAADGVPRVSGVVCPAFFARGTREEGRFVAEALVGWLAARAAA